MQCASVRVLAFAAGLFLTRGAAVTRRRRNRVAVGTESSLETYPYVEDARVNAFHKKLEELSPLLEDLRLESTKDPKFLKVVSFVEKMHGVLVNDLAPAVTKKSAKLLAEASAEVQAEAVAKCRRVAEESAAKAAASPPKATAPPPMSGAPPPPMMGLKPLVLKAACMRTDCLCTCKHSDTCKKKKIWETVEAVSELTPVDQAQPANKEPPAEISANQAMHDDALKNKIQGRRIKALMTEFGISLEFAKDACKVDSVFSPEDAEERIVAALKRTGGDKIEAHTFVKALPQNDNR